MGKLVDTGIEDKRWKELGLKKLAEQAARAVLAELGLAEPETKRKAHAISLLGCDDTRNETFRDKPQPTNVLSWPEWDLSATVPGGMPERPAPGAALGNIAIAWETCAREAAEQGKPMIDHVTHLIVHGTLHLLGYDHSDDSDAARMEGLEVKILASLGLSDPYH